MSARAAQILGLAVVVAIASGASAAAERAREALPTGYRGWRHVRSIAVTDPEHDMYGFHDGYANDAALRGLRARPVRFEDGATFVVSLFDIARKDGVTSAGAKRRTVVQVKDRRAAATGGWRFAAFDPAGKPIQIDEASCFRCHITAEERDFVFTDLRE